MTNLRNIEENLAINATLRQVEEDRRQHEQPRKRMVAIGCATSGGAFVVVSVPELRKAATDDGSADHALTRK
jgi:uncharacterized DUF497 family protein